MAKKPKKVKKYAGKTEEEWRNWGEKFGKNMEKRGKEFGKEMEEFGERFGKHMEHRAKKWEKEWRDWWFISFGFIGPLVGSIIGIVFLSFGILVLRFINLPLDSGFISGLSTFILAKLHWFFAAFLFFGYSDYFSRRYSKTYWVVSPLINSIGAVFVIWVGTWILTIINNYAQSSLLAAVSNVLYENLVGIFFLFLIFGYIVVIVKKMFMGVFKSCE